jgi:hypothetical protein
MSKFYIEEAEEAEALNRLFDLARPNDESPLHCFVAGASIEFAELIETICLAIENGKK